MLPPTTSPDQFAQFIIIPQPIIPQESTLPVNSWDLRYSYQPFASVLQMPQEFVSWKTHTHTWICWTCFLWSVSFLGNARVPEKKSIAHLLEWLCQQDAHHNSVNKDVLHCSRVFCLSLMSYAQAVIPGNIEPWPECQLELVLDLQPTNDLSWYSWFLLQPTDESNSPNN